MADGVRRDAQLPGMADPVTAPEGFRGPQVCALVGITYRQLDYWARTGLLRPSIADARGSGTQRRYSYPDVARAEGDQAAARRRHLACSGRGEPSSACATASAATWRPPTSCSSAPTPSWPAATVRSSTSSKAARASSTSFRCRACVEELDADIVRIERDDAVPSPGGRAGDGRREARAAELAAPLGAGGVGRRGLRPRLRTPLRRAARLLRRAVGVRAGASSSCEWHDDGTPDSAFRPDFYLPDHGCFIELTTLDQKPRHPEERQGAPPARASPGHRGEAPLPAGLSGPAGQVRLRPTAPRPPHRLAGVTPPDVGPRRPAGTRRATRSAPATACAIPRSRTSTVGWGRSWSPSADG